MMLMLSVPLRPAELVRAGIRHHHDGQRGDSAIHGARVLQQETAFASVELAVT